jgi:hypothetical protein
MTITSEEIAAAEVAEDESLLERRLRFLSLRNSGLTFGAIAERWNKQQRAAQEAGGPKARTLTVTTVRRDVEQAKLAIIGEATREGMIAEVYSVILDVRRANYVPMLNGDVDAAKIVLSTARDQRELFGLDQPKRMAVGVGTDVEFAEEMLSLMHMIGDTADAQKQLMQVASSERMLDVIDVEPEADPVSRETAAVERPNPFVDAASSSNVDGRAHGATPTPSSSTPSHDPVPADEWTNLGS